MNLGTLVVLLIVLAIVALILRGTIRGKLSGKSTCGGNCASCGHGCAAPAAQGQNDTAVPVVTTLKIDGMACGMCESHINDTIRQNFNVKTVKSSFKTGITVIMSDELLDEQKLHQVIDPTGYHVLEYSTTAKR